MADLKFSQMPQATVLTDTTIIPVVDQGQNQTASLDILSSHLTTVEADSVSFRAEMISAPASLTTTGVSILTADASGTLSVLLLPPDVNDTGLKIISSFESVSAISVTVNNGIGFATISLPVPGATVVLLSSYGYWSIISTHLATIA